MKLIRPFLLLCLLLQMTCHSANRQSTDTVAQQEKPAVRLIASKTLDHSFFAPINEVTKQAGLPKLRGIIMPPGDLEVRLWGGFGTGPLDMFLLNRNAGQWSAIDLSSDIYADPPKILHRQALSAPKSGWEGCWQRLVGEQLLTLPDGGFKGVRDGYSYIVELNQDRAYRAFHFDNPYVEPTKEDLQMIEIGHIIAEEFGVDRFDMKPNVEPYRRHLEKENKKEEQRWRKMFGEPLPSRSR